jgi:PKD repeat protein
MMRTSPSFLLWLGLLGSAGAAVGQPTNSPQRPVDPAARYTPYERTDKHSPIGGDLQRVYRRWQGLGDDVPHASAANLPAAFPRLIFSPDGARVLVRLTARDVAALLPKAAGRGFVAMSNHSKLHFVDGYLPIDQLAPGAAGICALRSQGLLGVLAVQRGQRGQRTAVHATSSVRPVGTRSVKSEADYILQSDRVRALGGYDGRGLKIGVMSDSYDFLGHAAQDIANGELPAEGVDVLTDLLTTSNAVDEGRAMCQLVHDVAPGAALAFASVTSLGSGDFADQIHHLVDSAHCRILTDDVYYGYEPFYQRGVIGQAYTDVATRQGVACFAAAGNMADHGAEWGAPVFLPRATGDAAFNFNPNPAGPPDTDQHYSLGQGQGFGNVLHWSDPYYTTAGVQTDLDMYLVSSRGDTVAAATDDSRLDQTPTNGIDFYNDTSQTHTTDFYLTIVRRAGTADPARLHLWYRAWNDQQAPLEDEWPLSGGGNGDQHEDIPEVMAMAAAATWNSTVPEPYASNGGNLFLFAPDGTPLSAPISYAKPDATAVDGCLTTEFFRQRPVSGQWRFYGSSASSPNGAAVAALLWQAEPSLSVQQLYARLRSTAHDIGAPGTDSFTGTGLLNAFSAIYGTPTTTVVPAVIGHYLETMDNGALGRAWEVKATGAARPWVRPEGTPGSGKYHLVLDASAQDTTASQRYGVPTGTSEAILHLDMTAAVASGNMQILYLRHKIFAGETGQVLPLQFTGSVPGDGISLSVDGGTQWYRISNLATETNTTYQVGQPLLVHLTAAAAALNLTLGSDVRIKFQQTGVVSLDSTGGPRRGGRAFDDMMVKSVNPLASIGGAFAALFSADGATVADCPSLTVQYHSTSYYAQPGGLSTVVLTPTYDWTFPGGTPATSTDPNPVVTYNTAGRFPATLTLTQRTRTTNPVPGPVTRTSTITDTAFVVIQGRAPQPTATVSKTFVCTNEAVAFGSSATFCPTGFRWRFPGGTPATSTAPNPSVTYGAAGTYRATLIAHNAYGQDSVLTQEIVVKPTRVLPLTEDFNAVATNEVPPYWERINPDGSVRWLAYTTFGAHDQAVGVNFHDYPAVGERDQLRSVPMTLATGTNTLRFDLAYTTRVAGTNQDSLLIRVLTPCVPHQVLGTIYRKGGAATLATFAGTDDYFFPSDASMWRRESVDLTPYQGQAVLLEFESYNDFGNILWVDDVQVDHTPTGLHSVSATTSGLYCWPNPVAGHGALTIETPASPGAARIQLLDVLGRTVWTQAVDASSSPTRQTVTAPTAAGMYTLRYTTAYGQPLVRRVVVE